MTAPKDLDRQIQSFLVEGPTELPEPSYAQVRDRIEQKRQRADFGLWRTPTMNNLKNTLKLALAAAAGVVVVIVGLGALRTGPAPGASPSPTASASAPQAAATELLDSFIAARVAGAGAEQYLDNEVVIPLLYATTSGARYERAEFEQVQGIEWPYGLMAFKVRLFAGNTVVEQLLFTRLEADPGTPEFGPQDGRPGLWYQPDGYGTHIAPTTEDGQPVPAPYSAFDGAVTLHTIHPWVSIFGSGSIRLIPEDPSVLPTTDGGQRNDWDVLSLMADPRTVGSAAGGADCQKGSVPADAAALAENIRSNPDVEATDPVAVSVGGNDALMMDVAIPAGASICNDGVLLFLEDPNAAAYCPNTDTTVCTVHASGDRVRLYLFDAPEGSAIAILVIAIVAPETRLESLAESAAPIIDSVEFHTP